jgi:predicted metal-binding membrane protein
MSMGGMDMSMRGLDMTGFQMISSGIGLMVSLWSAKELAFLFVMWTLMMVGMMTLSVAPMFLMYARIGRQTEAQSRPLAATAWFAIGYFLVWVVFALLASFVQWVLERNALLDFRMAITSSVLGGLLFLVAGLYQWTRLNEKCLTECQRPFAFVMRHGGYRRDAPGCIMLGLRHGTYCVGCCWALMALLLVGGVMNVYWIVVLASFVFFGAGLFQRSLDRSPWWHGPHHWRCVVVLDGNVLMVTQGTRGPAVATNFFPGPEKSFQFF